MLSSTPRVADKNWFQRVRVKPDEKLKPDERLKTAAVADACRRPSSRHRSPDGLWDLSSDFDFNANSNGAVLPDLDNSQMSSLFREFSGGDGQRSLLKDERSAVNANYKTVGRGNGPGVYVCELCPFLCLDGKSLLEHKERDNHGGPAGRFQFKVLCIGCDNVFHSESALRCHLIEDHKVLSNEIDKLVQIAIEASDEDIEYENELSPQVVKNNLADFESINDTILKSLEPDLKSHFIDTHNQITEEDNFVDNCPSSDTSFWENQEQIFNELQDKNIKNDNNAIDKPREKRFGCLIRTCKMKFETEDNALYHEKCHYSIDGFRCIEFECKYTNTKWSTMMTHLWKSHGVDMEMFSCNQCEFKTNSLYKLNAFHINIHKQEKPFLCPECNKGFKSIKQLRNHKIIHNKKTNAKNSLTCMHCSRHFLTKSMMHQHITSVHIRARPYACQMCSYTTSTTSSLKLHLRSHTGEKPFKCEECFYSTADHNTLRKHKMRHTGQKKYTCPLCNYSSIQSTSYKKHLETKHPGMDDGIIYSCDMCNFTFIRKDLYMQHIVKHKEDALPLCEPLVCLDEIFNEKEKIQAEIGEQPCLMNTIRVKPLNSLKPNQIVPEV